MNLEELPWIKSDDENTINYAVPYLPDDPIILEAGTSVGSDTQSFKKKWPNSTIYGFEPHPDNYQASKQNTMNLSNIYLYNSALSDCNEKKTFYISNLMAGASSLLQDNLSNITVPEDVKKDFTHASYDDIPTEVQCITVNQFCEDNNIKNIDYIWLDTEGSEYNILKFATNILSTVKVVSIELNFQEFRKGMSKFEDVYNLLIEYGFTLKYIWGRPTWQSVGIFVKE